MLCQLQSIALLYSSIIPEIFRLCRRLRVYPHLFLSLSLLFCVSLIHVIFEHLPPVATMLIEILFAFGFINFEDSRNLLHILVVNSLFTSQFQLFQNESRFLFRHIGYNGLITFQGKSNFTYRVFIQDLVNTLCKSFISLSCTSFGIAESAIISRSSLESGLPVRGLIPSGIVV